MDPLKELSESIVDVTRGVDREEAIAATRRLLEIGIGEMARSLRRVGEMVASREADARRIEALEAELLELDGDKEALAAKLDTAERCGEILSEETERLRERLEGETACVLALHEQIERLTAWARASEAELRAASEGEHVT